MKIKTVLSACIALMLGGCASYSGNTYRQDVAYADDAYYDSSDTYQSDQGYYVDTYYDGGYYDDGYYDRYDGGSYFGFGYGDPFYSGGSYGYCSLGDVFCPGDPFAQFLFPIGGGRYWLLFDGYDNRSYYYGNGYGYGWPYGWGYPHDNDWNHHHHHHHDHPDPVAGTPPPNGWVPSPRDGRLILTPHPRKGVFRPNGAPPPNTDLSDRDDVGPTPRDRAEDSGNNPPPNGWVPSPRDGRRFLTPRPRKGVFTANGAPPPNSDLGDRGEVGPTPRNRVEDSGGNPPPMRWRPPPTMTTGPVDGTSRVRTRRDPVYRPIQGAPSDQTRFYVSEPRTQPEPRRTEDRPVTVDRPTRSISTPDPQPANAPNRDSNDDRADRGRRRADGSGGG